MAAASVRLASPRSDGARVCWLEGRPSEGGRVVVVQCAPGGTARDRSPTGFSVRSRAQEYGGGAYAVSAGVLYLTNDADQRVYRQHSPDASPLPLTPEGPWRYADLLPDPARQRVLCVREALPASGGEPRSAIVAIPTAPVDGSPHPATSSFPAGRLTEEALPAPVEVLVEGPDFLASPRLSPDGSRLAWVAWNHPDMSWDASELWVAELDAAGRPGAVRRVAGGAGESVFQPEWGPDSSLFFVSDRTGWWNLYRWREGAVQALAPIEAECGLPQWVFGMSTYAVLADGTLACAYARAGTWHLARLDPEAGTLTEVPTSFTVLSDLAAHGNQVLAVAAGPADPPGVVRIDPQTAAIEVLRRDTPALGVEWIASPQAMRYPTAGGVEANGFYYAPRNPSHRAPPGERPPLIVRCHGGPTAAATPALDLTVQFWTTRGFAFADVNYGGSTGYGRAYRERLDGGWGVVDVQDCVAAARYLAAQGLVDPERTAVRGSSAGGFTALCALAFHDAFRAGAIYYGVSDLEALARDTHKLEAHYLDRLVGPYPAAREIYRARSPLYHAERIRAPVAFFQGLEDRVVPPDQTARMAEALQARGVPVAYHAFPGEGHGFRRAETLARALEAELVLYREAFGLGLSVG